MTWEQGLIVLAGAAAGGFVNGLTGFGTGLTAIGIWLHVLPPATTASLVIICSVIAQIQSLPVIWGRVDWARIAWFIFPGLLGVPLGAAVLAWIDVATFKLLMGLLLVGYAGLALWLGTGGLRFAAPPAADAAVGLASGVLGGLAGLSGALMVIWTDLRDETKEVRRTLLQTFNLIILSAALVGHWGAGHLTREVGIATLFALPGTLSAAWLGARLYQRLGQQDYRRIVLLMLFVSGLTLVFSYR